MAAPQPVLPSVTDVIDPVLADLGRARSESAPAIQWLNVEPHKYDIQVPCGDRAFLRFDDGTLIGLPAPGKSLRAGDGDVLSLCRSGVVLRAPLLAENGEPTGSHAALKVMSKAAMRSERDSVKAELEVLERLAPRGLSAVAADGFSRPAPGIPRYDFYEDDVNVYVATELAAGGTLRDWGCRSVRALKDAGVFPLWYSDHVPRLFVQLVDAVAYMHSRGVVHLDLDPRNLVVATSVDEEGRMAFELLVIDFGSSRFVSAERGHGALVGDSGVKFKLPFMSPQERSYYHHGGRYEGCPADVFHVGAILWWLLALPPSMVNPMYAGDETIEEADVMHDEHGYWVCNVLRHCSGRHSGRSAPSGEYKVNQCLFCRWDLSIPVYWAQILLSTLHFNSECRASSAELRDTVHELCAELDRCRFAEAAAECSAKEIAEASAALIVNDPPFDAEYVGADDGDDRSDTRCDLDDL